MAQTARRCIVAKSHEYKYCGKCGGYNRNETWRNLFCSENCRDIYKTVEKYIAKKLTAEEALCILNTCQSIPEDKVQPTLANRLREIGYY